MPISAQSYDYLEQVCAGHSDTLTNMLPRDASIETYLSHKQVRPACPRCGGDTLVRNGKRAGRQRFRCAACGKTVGLTVGTPYYRTKQNFGTWKEFVRCVETKTPLREIAERCGISEKTACQWRKKYLAVMLRIHLELIDVMQAKGLLKDEADMEELGRLVEAELRRFYRGRDRQKVLARLERAKEKAGMRLRRVYNRFLQEQAKHHPFSSNPLYGSIPTFTK